MSLFDIPANLVALARLCRPPVPTGHEVWLQAVEEELECLEPQSSPPGVEPSPPAPPGGDLPTSQLMSSTADALAVCLAWAELYGFCDPEIGANLVWLQAELKDRAACFRAYDD